MYFKRLAALVVVTAALLFPTNALAAPFAQLDDPVDNQCIGTIHSVKGKATWTGTGSWTFTLRRADTNGLLQTSTGTFPVPPWTISFDTRTLPTGVTFLEQLDVTEQNSGLTAIAQRSFTPRFDREKPTSPSVEAVPAASGRSAWVEFTNSADLGCAGLAGYTGIATTPGGTFAIFGQNQVDVNAVKHGTLHEAISLPNLTANTDYRLNVYSTDKVGNNSIAGGSYILRTPPDYNTVVAGQVKGSNGQLLMGENVSATPTECCLGPPVQRSTNGSGWYNLSLQGQGAGWLLQYGPGCTMVMCSQGWGTATESYRTPVEAGTLVPKHKVLQPAG